MRFRVRTLIGLVAFFALAAWGGQYYWGDPTGGLIRAVREAPDAKARGEAITNLVLNRDRINAAATVRILIWAMRDRSRYVRVSAASASACFTPASAKAIPNLIGLLRDEEEVVRVASASALGSVVAKTGQDRDHAVAALLEVLDRHTVASLSAARALIRIGRGHLAIPALIRMVKSEDDYLSQGACGRLGDIGPMAASALIEAMSDDRPRTRAEAAFWLVWIGRIDRALPILKSLATSEDQKAAETASLALEHANSLMIRTGAAP